jgi:hypothetical protein
MADDNWFNWFVITPVGPLGRDGNFTTRLGRLPRNAQLRQAKWLKNNCTTLASELLIHEEFKHESIWVPSASVVVPARPLV